MASEQIKQALRESGLIFSTDQASTPESSEEPLGGLCILFCREQCWLGCINLCDSGACFGSSCVGTCALQCMVGCVVDRRQ